MEFLNNITIILTTLSILIGIVSISVGVWSIITHREKLYKEKIDEYNKQLKRVKNNLEKRSPANDEQND